MATETITTTDTEPIKPPFAIKGKAADLNQHANLEKFSQPVTQVEYDNAVNLVRSKLDSISLVATLFTLNLSVYGVDAATGKQKWKFTRSDGSLGYANPLYDSTDKTVYVSGETNLYRLDPLTGKQMWQAYVGGKSTSTPDVGGGRVYVSGDGTGISAFATSTGSPAWNFKGEKADDWFGTPLYAAGTVYVSTYNRYVYAVDAATGKVKWTYRLLGNALSQPALDAKRGVLYVTSTTFRDNPTLTALDAKTGKLLWNFKAGYVDGAPILGADRLYVGSTNGYYYAFSLD